MKYLDIMYLCAGEGKRAKDFTNNGEVSKHSIKGANNQTPMDFNLLNNIWRLNSFILTKEKYISEYEKAKNANYIIGLKEETKETSHTVRLGVNKIYQLMEKWLSKYVIIYCGDNVYNKAIDLCVWEMIEKDSQMHKLYSIGVKVDKPEDFINLQKDGSWKDKTKTYISDFVMAGIWAVRWKDLNKWTSSEKWDDSLPIWKNLEKFVKKNDVLCPKREDIHFLDVGTPERIKQWKEGIW